MKKIFIAALTAVCLMAQTATVNVTLANVDQISLNDLNLFSTGTVKQDILTASMSYNFGGTHSMSLRLIIRRNQDVILDGRTNVINNVTSGDVAIDNTNLNSGISINSTVPGQSLDIDSYTFNDGVLSAGELALGALPNGNYTFTLEVYANQSVQPLATSTGNLNINNDWQVDLNGPADLEPISTRPFFQWTTNAQFKELNLYVWEINNAGATTDQIVSQPPIYTHTTTNPNELDHQYPPEAAQLQAGKWYAWTVKGAIDLISGRTELENTVNKFIFQDAGSVATDQYILGLLQSILGESYDGVMKEFEGYSPTGTIKLNGSNASAQDLSALINAIQAGSKKTLIETN